MEQKNDLEDERQPAEDEEEREAGEEEEEEVKPDKLQLLLQQTKFSCAELKDGYYADEAVECQIFHYCQDRTRHSWLCPEGATFHQVNSDRPLRAAAASFREYSKHLAIRPDCHPPLVALCRFI